MLMDGFTHFSVPPFLPFSDRKLELDADVAINFVTLVVSVVSFYLLLGVERGHVAFWIYLATVYILILFFAAYFILRLSGRFWAARQLRRMGRPGVPVPTTNPFTWLLLHESKSGGRLTMWFARYTIGRGITKGPFTMDIPTPPLPGTGPVESQVEALSRSYPIALEEGRFFSDSYLFAEVDSMGAQWVATWYSLEFSAFGRAASVRVTFAPDGKPVVSHPWLVPRWRRGAA